jgi:hypothetical protein
VSEPKNTIMKAALFFAGACEFVDDLHEGLPIDECIERAGRTTRMRRQAIRKASAESRGKRKKR